MADIALTAKREALAQVYSLWIKNVTGSTPNIQRTANGRNIVLNDSQINLMSEDMYKSMTAESSPNDLNVSMPWGPILLPAVTKKYWPYALGAFVMIAGGGFMLGATGGASKNKKRKYKR